jgi:hypothetical protein
MKSIVSSVIAILAFFSFNTASAQSVVVKQYPTATDLGKDLQICIDFAGLGNISEIGIKVSYTAQVYTDCYNSGRDTGPVPGLSRTTSGSTTVTFPVHNGRASGCKSLGLSFSPGKCPSGNMTGVVSDVSFSNVSLKVYDKTFSVTVQ